MSFRHQARLGQLLAVTVALIVGLTSCNWKQFTWGNIGYNTGYAPKQPLPFSHKLHAGDNKIQCLYCHTNVEYAKHSAIPSLNICMNCHLLVATDKPAIKELQQKYFAGESVNWVKVHMLPDHVKFNHKRHVHRFSQPEDRYVACQKCHGEVAKMDVIEQISSLSMGWCVDCHRSSEPKGPLNCSTCHH
jgi:hypothetical protein